MIRSKTFKSCSKRLMSLFLATTLVLGLVPAIQAPARAVSWAQPYLDKLVDWNVMRGDQAGNLDPDRDINRAEFLSMINRAYGYDETAKTPFTDVLPSAWYADDVGIAYRAGYFTGTSTNTANPEDPLTREQATVILGRNLMLQQGLGESLDFTDSRQCSDWSRGFIKTAAEYGIVKGLPDGSFQPQRNITRGEVASLLCNSIGTPINKSGDYSMGNVYGNVTISASGVTLRNTTIAGDLYISGGVGLGYVTLENVTVLGKIIASGAGESNKGDSSIILRNVTAPEMVVDTPSNQFVTIRAEGDTNIAKTSVRTHSYLEDVTGDDAGLKLIELNGESGTSLELAGNIKEVMNLTPNSSLNMALGTAKQVTVDEKANGATLNIDGGAEIKTVNLDTGTKVTGSGDIENLNVNAAGSTVDTLPDNIVIRPGLNANINGTTMDSTTGAESSEDPRILSGYPRTADIAPTSLVSLFSTNKKGTVYWAVSSITDGSVGEADIISPPSYGAKILKSGNVEAKSSSVELEAKITGLTSAGSYYLSAVFVDDRDQHSPVKVIAFSTPDDSVPNFAAGYPVMSKITNTSAQVTVMPTKTCKLYYALLEKGGTAPTPADFKANAISGNFGFGTRDVKKNVTDVFPVNDKNLEELKDYDLYLWLTDTDGAKSSAVKKLSFKTVDKTPPTFVTEPYMTDQKETSVTFTTSINEAGSVFWVVVKSGDEYPKPLAGETGPVALDSEVAKLQVASGLNAFKKGTVTLGENKDGTINISGLTAETAYDLYYVAQDKSGNFSDTVKKQTFNTLDGNAPTASIEFTKFNGNETGTPLADTDIRIVFSERVQTFPEGTLLEDYYNDIGKAPAAEQNAKRSEMATALEGILTLYDLTGGDESLATVRNAANAASIGDAWTVDYRYAKITQEDGKTIITLPTTEDSTATPSALNLRSGSTYRFDVKGVSDASRNAIGTLNLPDKKGFTTVFAQVNLKVTNSYKITDPNDATDTNFNLHMCFTATPISTSKVSDTIYWDMLFWSDTSIQFELYRRELDANGNPKSDSAWTQVKGTGDGIGKITVSTGDEQYNGASYTKGILGAAHDFEQLNQLKNNYEYGIHVTNLKGNENEETWNATLNMMVGVAAGSNTNLSNLSIQGHSSWANAVNSRDINSIGNCVQQGSDEMTLKRLFSDSVAPEFRPGFPTFDPTDASVTMNVMLDRPGTVFYVIAPLGTITTELKEPTANGKAIDTSAKGHANYETLSGWDSDHDIPSTPQTDAETILSAPDYLNIVSDELSSGNPDIKWGRKDNVSVSSIPITQLDLKADTEYVVYFVTVGSSSTVYSDVLGYRFKTPIVTRPIIKLDVRNPSVTIETDRSSDVDYILILDDSRRYPGEFTETLGAGTTLNADKTEYTTKGNNWGGTLEQFKDTNYGSLMVWQALTTDVTDSAGNIIGSVFDLCASKSLKDRVSSLIRTQVTSDTVMVRSSTTTLAGRQQSISFENDFDMIPGTDYFFLSVATSQGSSDAYRGIRPVKKLTETPPKISTISANLNLDSTNPNRYSGNVLIQFDRPLYIKTEGTSSSPSNTIPVSITTMTFDPNNKTYVSIESLISSTIQYSIDGLKNEVSTTPISTLKLWFNGASSGSAFTFSAGSGEFSDASGSVNGRNFTVTLRVDKDDPNNAYFEVSTASWDAT